MPDISSHSFLEVCLSNESDSLGVLNVVFSLNNYAVYMHMEYSKDVLVLNIGDVI